MATVRCFEAKATDQGVVTWQKVAAPPHFVVRSGVAYLEAPGAGKRRVRAYVNGMEVIAGIQVVVRGDLVRIIMGKGEEASYVVGGVVADTVPGEGQPCSFSGLPIQGMAVRCACGAVLSEEAAKQIGQCPKCEEPLGGNEDEQVPGEELL